ncbi:MAG TPA: hypothetical protein VE615_11385 [Gaiellaceae bacterium]|jgi:hypothetical protein|nr:hypothetical protein [Gaiellaceae bacterium]
MLRTILHRLAILLFALVVASAVALGARADAGLPEGEVAVVAEPVADGGSGIFQGRGEIGDDGLITVFLQEPPNGFSDGGDVPVGMVVATAARAGFSDGGDIPEGFIAVLGQLPVDGFSDGGDVPEGMIAVRALPAGFSDGGDIPDGFVAVALQPLPTEAFSPPGG